MALAFKVVVMGAAGVGKTCLIVQLTSGKFLEAYDPTLEDSYRRQITVGADEVVLDIFDTAGQEDFRDSYMTTGDGFIIVYSVIEESSFEEVSAIYSRLTMLHEGKKTAGVLVGNKCDLVDIKITEEMGRLKAETMGWGFLVASAKSRVNILDIFQEVSRHIIALQGNTEAPPRQNASTSANSPHPSRRRNCQLF